MTGEARRQELSENLRAVRERLTAACLKAGRDPTEITLIAVTKTYPATDVVDLASLGVLDVGENRDQEASGKAAEVALAGPDVRWHFVGQLQRNKCRSVVSYAEMVHSVDGVRLAGALDEAASRRRQRPLDVLVQVNLDGDAARGGAVVGSTDVDRDLDRVLAAVAGSDSLVARGLMTVAPLGWDPDRAFVMFAELAQRVRREYPDASVLSAGMSGDVESAINHGATHVRMGTSLLGNRPKLM